MMLDLVPPQAKVALIGTAVIGALLFGAVTGFKIKGALDKGEIAEERAKAADYRAHMLQTLTTAENLRYSLEHERQTAIDTIREEAHAQVEKSQALAVAANATADRLRIAARDFALRSSASSSNPETAAGGQTTNTAALLLADLFGRADKRAGELAILVGQSTDAGHTCERSYDALTPPLPATTPHAGAMPIN